MVKRTKTLRCPTCQTIVQSADEHFPFCTGRCRLIDLGKWASGAYKISSPILDPEVLEGLSEDVSHRSDSNDDSESSNRRRRS